MVLRVAVPSASFALEVGRLQAGAADMAAKTTASAGATANTHSGSEVPLATTGPPHC